MNYDTPGGLTYDDPAAFYDSSPITPGTKKMARIKLDLNGIKVTELIEKGEQVGTAMDGNSSFASIAAKVTAFKTAVTELETRQQAYLAAKQTLDQKITLRDEQVEIVENLFRQLASASEGVSMEAAVLQSGGWQLRGAPEPAGPMTAPENLAATGGDLEGTSDLEWDPVRGAGSYVAECSETSNGPWQQFYMGTKSSCTATDLVSGQMYYFRVRAVGPGGPGPWSDIAHKRAS